MNPLDKLELFAFCRNLKEEMPMHTPNTAKIKRSYSQGMPKNLMDYSAFVNNHFLNDNLAIIEEIQHRDKSHPIPKWFREYQLRHYAKYGILKGDHFFGAKLALNPDLREHRAIGFLPYSGQVLGFGTIGDTKVLGTEVETDGSGGGSPNFGLNHLECAKCTSMIPNAFYDYLKWDLAAGAAGNVRVGLYDDSSGPNNLLSESASLTAVANYTTQYAITEVQVVQSSAWLTHNQDNNNSKWSYWATGIARWYRAGFAYGAFPNPWGGVTNDTNNAPRMKTGHS